MSKLKSLLWSALSFAGFGIAGASVGIGFAYSALLVKRSQEQQVIQGDFHALIQDVGKGKPVMVTLPGCPHCADARIWLAPRGWAVTEINIGTNERLQAVLDAHHINSTPTLITEQAISVGFSPNVWINMLSDKDRHGG